MANSIETIFDCATGLTSEREFTDAEEAAMNTIRAEAVAKDAAQEAAATKAASDAAAGKAKLKELGLTDDQIAALVG